MNNDMNEETAVAEVVVVEMNQTEYVEYKEWKEREDEKKDEKRIISLLFPVVEDEVNKRIGAKTFKVGRGNNKDTLVERMASTGYSLYKYQDWKIDEYSAEGLVRVAVRLVDMMMEGGSGWSHKV